MFYYEDMKSDVTFSVDLSNYVCKCWTGVSPLRIGDKDFLTLTTQCRDEGLYNFMDMFGKFNIDFQTSVKDDCFEEDHSLTNILNNMRLLLHQIKHDCENLTNHIFIFGNDTTTEEDAVNILQQEMKEEIIHEVCNRIIKHMRL